MPRKRCLKKVFHENKYRRLENLRQLLLNFNNAEFTSALQRSIQMLTEMGIVIANACRPAMNDEILYGVPGGVIPQGVIDASRYITRIHKEITIVHGVTADHIEIDEGTSKFAVELAEKLRIHQEDLAREAFINGNYGVDMP